MEENKTNSYVQNQKEDILSLDITSHFKFSKQTYLSLILNIMFYVVNIIFLILYRKENLIIKRENLIKTNIVFEHYLTDNNIIQIPVYLIILSEGIFLNQLFNIIKKYFKNI